MDGFGDFRSGLLAAKDRDLTPLAEACAEALGLDAEQLSQMEAFLNEAWFGGTYSGHEKLRRWAETEGRGPIEVDRPELEARFRSLTERSAEALNLSLPRTIAVWSYLSKAWIAGARSSEAQLSALVLLNRTDIGAEAERWLREKDG